MGLIAATGFLGNLSMWGYLRHFLVRVDWRALKIRRHFKETLVYFVPTIATSVYTILDKTMLGWFTGGDKTQNGYYEYATGFVNMAKILILSYNAVVSARMSYLFGEGRLEEIHRRVEESLNFVMLLGIPMAAGLAGIGPCFVPWFLGADMNRLLPCCMCAASGSGGGLKRLHGKPDFNAQRPAGAKRKGDHSRSSAQLYPQSSGNPPLGAAGAAGASVAAEVFITSLYLYLCRGYISRSLLVQCAAKRLAAAALMFALVRALGRRPGGRACGNLPAGGSGCMRVFSVSASRGRQISAGAYPGHTPEKKKIVGEHMESKDFYKEEVRCGYTVTEKTKKVWAVQLAMLDEVERICRKYGLSYFADSGTLIGCIRDKGYIPWDDDIDLVMLREDYDKFLTVAQKELADPLLLQTYRTEKNYLRGHAQIRNRLTTGCNEEDRRAGYSCGILSTSFRWTICQNPPWPPGCGLGCADRVDGSLHLGTGLITMKMPLGRAYFKPDRPDPPYPHGEGLRFL